MEANNNGHPSYWLVIGNKDDMSKLTLLGCEDKEVYEGVLNTLPGNQYLVHAYYGVMVDNTESFEAKYRLRSDQQG